MKWARLVSKTVCILCGFVFLHAEAQDRLVVVEWNVENLFDTRHDTLKNDYEFLPDGSYRWSRSRYWRKLNSY